MKSKLIALLAACALLISFASCVEPATTTPATEPATTPATVPATSGDGFDTVGYYAYRNITPSQIKFWKASGIDTIELLDIGWFFKPGAPLDNYRQEMKKEIEMAQLHGLKVYVIFLTNLEQHMGPSDYTSNGSGTVFNPANTEKMAQRLTFIEENLEVWNMADGFSLFAGDPGGVSGLPTQGGLEYYTDMVLDVYDLVKKHAPNAKFNANIWAVSQYVQKVANPFSVNFWISEGTLGRQMLAMKDFIGPEIGIEIPGHDYYRALALRLYYETGKKPESYFPNAQDVALAKQNGASRIWGFSHFLLDELDDGDSAGSSRTELPNFNTRYIKKYIDAMRAIEMTGVIAGNSTLNNAINLYAFARFAHDATLTPEAVLREYASYLVTEDGVDKLTEIFKFLENDANWYQKLPEQERLPLFETTLKDAKEAMAAFETLTVRTTKELVYDLPESPRAFMSKVRQRIEMMLPKGPQTSQPQPVTLPENVLMRITGFDNGEAGTSADSSYAKEGKSGYLQVQGQYAIAYAGYENGKKLDLKAAKESGATIRLQVYSSAASDRAGYIMFADSLDVMAVSHSWMADFPGGLQEGWNELAVSFDEGIDYISPITDWSQVGAWRIVLFGEDGAELFLDNLEIVAD